MPGSRLISQGMCPMQSEFARASIRVDLVAIDARARERFETIFRERGHGAYLVVNSTVAEVAIIDLDHPHGRAHWQQYCTRFPDRPLILVSNTEPPPVSGARFLRKPIQVNALLAVLEEVRQQLEQLDVIMTSAANRDSGDDGEPGTIKLPARSLVYASKFTPEREAASIVPGDGARALKPACQSNASGPQDAKRCTHSDPEDPTQPPALASLLPNRDPDFDRTSEEKTYRYPPSQHPNGPSVDVALKDSQHISGCTPPSCSFGQEVAQSDRYDKTRRINTLAQGQAQPEFVGAENRLLGRLQSAIEVSVSNQCATALILNDGRLIVDALRGRIHSSFNDDQLKQLATCPLASIQSDIRPWEADASDMPAISRVTPFGWEPIEAVLWKLALWTYHGSLPAGTRLEKRVYLRHWPNLTRLHPVPDAMRIASLWNEQPMTLGYTATALGIPEQHVFSFYCASHTIGLAGQARREADYLFQETTASAKGKRGFVSDMMKRLRFIGNH